MLIIGGTGRAGSQTARALGTFDDLCVDITIAGRNVSRGEKIVKGLSKSTSATMHAGNLNNRFAAVDVNHAGDLEALVAEHDVVVHTAGPFQGRNTPCEVLRASIKAGCDYVDICDDVSHAEMAVSLATKAKQAGTRALICTGVYPGLSNLAAKSAAAELGSSESPNKVNIWYYTAGSGGIGPTVLASTFLILSEKVQVYDSSGAVRWKMAGSEREEVNFGANIGPRTTYLLNLPEIPSLHANILEQHGGGECTAKFATGPAMWNALLQFTAKYGPKHLMRDTAIMTGFAKFSMGVVRLVDLFVGSRTAFMVKVNDRICVKYEHQCLRESVGETTAAFVAELIRDRGRNGKDSEGENGEGKEEIDSSGNNFNSRRIEAGVYYPEQLCGDVRERICKDATKTADLYDINIS